MRLAENSIPFQIKLLSEELQIDENPSAVQLTGKSSLRQLILGSQTQSGQLHPNDPVWYSQYAISTTQQSAIADALANTASLWDLAIRHTNPGKDHGTSPQDQQNSAHRIFSDYWQPYTTSYCAPDLIQGQDDERPVAFPIAPWIDYNVYPGSLGLVNGSIFDVPVIQFPSVVRAELLQLRGSAADNRVKWVDLPQSVFNSTSIGVIILLPQTPQQQSGEDPSTDILSYIIGAGWGQSLMNVSSARYSISSASSLVSYDTFRMEEDGQDDPSEPSAYEVHSDHYQSIENVEVSFNVPYYPTRLVETSAEWAEYLNPFVPELNTTVIDFLLKTHALNGSRAAVPDIEAQIVLSGLMTNGMARIGYAGDIQGTIRLTKDVDNETIPDGTLWYQGKQDFFVVNPEDSRGWIRLRVYSTLQGYAYDIAGSSPKIAVTFLLLYCFVAIAHFFYSGISGTVAFLHIPATTSTRID